ncbi:unnamed protein product [Linum tenue]|uniref:Uncharacterized protein n=1 Tax=Linum tenue TaxID=586396 RepID=A0AAV0LJ09_9ROSI|nr:unnamed protein product [Linum tenue]
MKSKGLQGKRARAPIPSNNVLSVSESNVEGLNCCSWQDRQASRLFFSVFPHLHSFCAGTA